MSNENINVHTEDPKPAAAETAAPGAEPQKPTAEQPKKDAEQPAAPAAEMPKDPRAEEPAAVATEEKGTWDAICDHFSNNWQTYAAGGAGLAVGIAIGIAIAKKGSSTESAPAEA